MQITEVVGILVLECSCKQKFVANTTALDTGFMAKCGCGKWAKINKWSQLDLVLRQGTCSEFHDPAVRREFNKPLNDAMTIEEYKRLLADYIISGKVQKYDKKHKGVVSLENDEPQILAAYEALRAMNYKKDQAIEAIDIAVKNGYRYEQDIIKYILQS